MHPFYRLGQIWSTQFYDYWFEEILTDKALDDDSGWWSDAVPAQRMWINRQEIEIAKLEQEQSNNNNNGNNDGDASDASQTDNDLPPRKYQHITEHLAYKETFQELFGACPPPQVFFSNPKYYLLSNGVNPKCYMFLNETDQGFSTIPLSSLYDTMSRSYSVPKFPICQFL